MSLMLLSNYYITGNEKESFDMGNSPQLDPYDGFYDQNLDGCNKDDELIILVNNWELRDNRSSVTLFRNALEKMSIVEGVLTENKYPYRFKVKSKELFFKYIESHKKSIEDQAMLAVQRERKAWDNIYEFKKNHGEGRGYRFYCNLPSVSELDRAKAERELLVEIRDFSVGVKPPYLKPYPLFLQFSQKDETVQVIQIGSNDINSSLVFYISDIEHYKEVISSFKREAKSNEELRYWTYLEN